MNDAEFRRRAHAWFVLHKKHAWCDPEGHIPPDEEGELLLAGAGERLRAPPFDGSRQCCGVKPPTCGPEYHSPTCDAASKIRLERRADGTDFGLRLCCPCCGNNSKQHAGPCCANGGAPQGQPHPMSMLRLRGPPPASS